MNFLPIHIPLKTACGIYWNIKNSASLSSYSQSHRVTGETKHSSEFWKVYRSMVKANSLSTAKSTTWWTAERITQLTFLDKNTWSRQVGDGGQQKLRRQWSSLVEGTCRTSDEDRGYVPKYKGKGEPARTVCQKGWAGTPLCEEREAGQAQSVGPGVRAQRSGGGDLPEAELRGFWKAAHRQ